QGYKCYSAGAACAQYWFENRETKYRRGGCGQHQAINNRWGSTQRRNLFKCDPGDNEQTDMRKNQCQNKAALSQQQVSRNTRHAYEYGCGKRLEEGQLAVPRVCFCSIAPVF